MRSSARALAPLEVAVRRRRAALTRREHVRVHPETHRAACATPFEPGFGEHAVEAFGLRLLLPARRSRDDHCAHAGMHPASLGDGCGRAEILDARVRARA